MAFPNTARNQLFILPAEIQHNYKFVLHKPCLIFSKIQWYFIIIGCLLSIQRWDFFSF